MNLAPEGNLLSLAQRIEAEGNDQPAPSKCQTNIKLLKRKKSERYEI